VTLVYDPAYARIAYTGGDVPRSRGVCSDVLIRAFRTQGVDLQQLVHEDMRASFASYPRDWGLGAPTATSTTAACRTSRSSSSAAGSRCRSRAGRTITGRATWSPTGCPAVCRTSASWPPRARPARARCSSTTSPRA
jgi:hypothetical protein